jgi:hypothetical protein
MNFPKPTVYNIISIVFLAKQAKIVLWSLTLREEDGWRALIVLRLFGS